MGTRKVKSNRTLYPAPPLTYIPFYTILFFLSLILCSSLYMCLSHSFSLFLFLTHSLPPLSGTITGLRNYGAFLELDGGMAGLLHISQISYDRVDNLETLFTIGQRCKVLPCATCLALPYRPCPASSSYNTKNIFFSISFSRLSITIFYLIYNFFLFLLFPISLPFLSTVSFPPYISSFSFCLSVRL